MGRERRELRAKRDFDEKRLGRDRVCHAREEKQTADSSVIFAVELCRFVKDTLNPQPVPVEEDIIDENSDPYQYRSKRMSKSPSNSILKGTSSEELSAYLNRFVLQEVKVTCPFCNASLVELKFDALFADLSSILSSGLN